MRLGVLAVAVVAGCAGDKDESPAPTGETGTPGPTCADGVSITYVEGGCLGYADQWDYKVDVAGCAASATLDSWETSGALAWDESHPMTLTLEGQDGAYQNWALGPLPHQTAQQDWQAGVNSVFDCYAHASTLTWAARVYDADGAVLACVMWGHDPALVQGGGASAVNTESAAAYADCEIRAY
jgi:hypothetical protein